MRICIPSRHMDTPQKHGMYHGRMMMTWSMHIGYVGTQKLDLWWCDRNPRRIAPQILHVADEFQRVAGFMIVYEQTCTRLLFLLPARKWWHMVTKPSKVVPQRWALIYQRCQRFPPLKRLPWSTSSNVVSWSRRKCDGTQTMALKALIKTSPRA